MKKKVNNKILSFWHCKNCLKKLPDGVSPQEWSQTSVGWTPKGFQVWCNRCDQSVVAFDLKENKVGYDHEDDSEIVETYRRNYGCH